MSRKNNFYVTMCVTVATFSFMSVKSSADESVESFLRAFHQDPARMMQRIPSIVDEFGVAHPQGYIREDDSDWKNFIKFRSKVRNEIFSALEDDGPADGLDRPESIVESGPILKNITEMQARNLNQARSPEAPWADSYWPIYHGLIGMRYAERDFPAARDWQDNYAYIRNNSASDITVGGDILRINTLSPAEKYDFVIGDTNFGLTNYSWQQGEKYHNDYGMVPKWVGICHGWAAAALMSRDISGNSVVVKAPSGLPVTFFPQDIKALQSMLWAKGAPRARIAGTRCNVSKPRRNANGRILDQNCFDVSPNTWHIAAVNQLGIHKRSFVLDNTYDYEVWNFPILSFKYNYFNPQTWREGVNLQNATIPIESFKVDKFREFRNQDTRFIVGIFMDVTFVIETRPTRRIGNGKLPTKTVRLIYDLELNANQEIIGGEWYSNGHPDFIWTFDRDSIAQSSQDKKLIGSSWDLQQPVPVNWTEAAKRASERGIPLNSFVQQLIK